MWSGQATCKFKTAHDYDENCILASSSSNITGNQSASATETECVTCCRHYSPRVWHGGLKCHNIMKKSALGDEIQLNGCILVNPEMAKKTWEEEGGICHCTLFNLRWVLGVHFHDKILQEKFFRRYIVFIIEYISTPLWGWKSTQKSSKIPPRRDLGSGICHCTLFSLETGAIQVCFYDRKIGKKNIKCRKKTFVCIVKHIFRPF